MVKSMTGFGRAELSDEKHKMLVEMKAVNHRYLDMNIKLPKKFYALESRVRTLLKAYAGRGKLDVFISYEDERPGRVALKYNRELAAEYLAYLREMQREFGIADNVTATELSRYPEVLSMEEQAQDEDELWEALEKTLRAACEKFVETREREERISPGIFWKSLTAWRIR